jgi:2-polyprenyl-6-methoxyphenol hydroxylase-like FAD-dependent oxidoreductase
MGIFSAGRISILINRGEHWQCAFVIPKGSLDQLRANGLPAFRAEVTKLAPFLGERSGELGYWTDVKLLTVKVDRLRKWYRPGLLCIGDAAHAMSPIGGVGINLAIQDAVAAANILARPLRDGRLSDEHLRQVQQRRELPTRIVQWLQVVIQNRVITRVLADKQKLTPPLPVRLLARFPILRRIPARFVGIGVRPEHVQTSAV